MHRFFHHHHPHSEHGRFAMIALHIGFGVLLAATLALVFGYVVMLLWNHLMPEAFGLPAVSYWQGVGLLLLARILTGGIGHGHGRRGHHGRHPDEQPWKEYDQWWREAGERNFRDRSGQTNGQNT
jgi:hypothetical protein